MDFGQFLLDRVKVSSKIIAKFKKHNLSDTVHLCCEFVGDNRDIKGGMSSLMFILVHFVKWLYMLKYPLKRASAETANAHFS